MLFVWITLWMLAIIIFKVNRDNDEMCWVALLCFFSGMGAMCSLLRKQIIPGIDLGQFHVPVRYAVSVLHSLVYVMAPYCMGVYCVITSNLVKENFPFIYKHIKKILIVPPILMYVLFPVGLKYKAPFAALCIWVVPLCIISNFLLIHSYVTEKNIFMKQQRLGTCLLLTPPTIFDTISNYVLTAAGNHFVWGYVNYVVFVTLLIFVAVSATYGTMGIRLRFEKYRIESARKTSTSGTAILNHTLKNEIMKISICIDNIKHLINSSDDAEFIRKNTLDDFNLAELSSQHMLDMMKKIKDNLKDITLNESPESLNKLIEEGIMMVKPYLDGKKITIQKAYEIDATIICDPLHVKEMLINIFKNSIEAVNFGGKVSIQLYKNGKWITIIVGDNGIGIEKANLPYVLEPFFSTKRTGVNYGLGLSYCYNVMQQHKGSIEIHSRRNFGTIVCMNFNVKKAVQVTHIAFKEEKRYGEDKSYACG